MRRVPIWATAFMFVAGASLAAPSLDAPMRAPQPERPTLSDDGGLEALAQSVDEEMAAEAFQIAGKGRGGGGKRGGGKRKSRGGFKSGNKRSGLRGGEPGRPGRVGDPGGIRGGRIDRDVNIDRDVDVHGGGHWDDDDWDDDDDELEAALIGGVVGLGIGSLINNSEY
jgi:hypothetical protein